MRDKLLLGWGLEGLDPFLCGLGIGELWRMLGVARGDGGDRGNIHHVG